MERERGREKRDRERERERERKRIRERGMGTISVTVGPSAESLYSDLIEGNDLDRVVVPPQPMSRPLERRGAHLITPSVAAAMRINACRRRALVYLLESDG